VPTHKPNHLLGIADVESIHRAVPLGVDTFDSCFPTRNARHGSVLYRLPPPTAWSPNGSGVSLNGSGVLVADDEQSPSSSSSKHPLRAMPFDGVFPHGIGKLSLKKAEFALSFDDPIDAQCSCYTCRHHSRAYLNHLVRANEPMAASLLTLHNVQFMCDLMAQVRGKILQDEL